jgi:hypothetical protein
MLCQKRALSLSLSLARSLVVAVIGTYDTGFLAEKNIAF